MAAPKDVREWTSAVDQLLRRQSIDPERRQRAARALRVLEPKRQQIARGADAYRDVLRGRISHDRAADRPPCTCGRVNCPVSNGDLPPRVRRAADVDQAIDQFVADHGGTPKSLLRGRHDWSGFVADVVSRLREVHVYLSDESGETTLDGPLSADSEQPTPETDAAENGHAPPADHPTDDAAPADERAAGD